MFGNQLRSVNHREVAFGSVSRDGHRHNAESDQLTYSPQQATAIELFSPERPHPSLGVRVNAFGSRYYDVQTLTHGSLEDRARLGKRMLEMDRQGLEVIGDDRVPWLHCWSGTDIFAAAYGSKVHRPENDIPFAQPAVMTAVEANRLQERPTTADCGCHPATGWTGGTTGATRARAGSTCDCSPRTHPAVPASGELHHDGPLRGPDAG